MTRHRIRRWALSCFLVGLVLFTAVGLSDGSPSGALASPLATAIASWEYDQIAPAVAYSSTSAQYLVVWEDHHWGYGNDWDIYGRRVAENGSTVGGAFGIGWEDPDGVVRNRMAPDVAYNSSYDEYLVVFEYAFSSTDHDIHARRVSADGTLVGTTDLSTAFSTAWQSNPSVAYSAAANEYLVVYEQRAGSGEFVHNDIYGVIVGASGVAGTPFIISSNTSAKAALDVAYTDTDGHFLVSGKRHGSVWGMTSWDTT